MRVYPRRILHSSVIPSDPLADTSLWLPGTGSGVAGFPCFRAATSLACNYGTAIAVDGYGDSGAPQNRENNGGLWDGRSALWAGGFEVLGMCVYPGPFVVGQSFAYPWVGMGDRSLNNHTLGLVTDYNGMRNNASGEVLAAHPPAGTTGWVRLQYEPATWTARLKTWLGTLADEPADYGADLDLSGVSHDFAGGGGFLADYLDGPPVGRVEYYAAVPLGARIGTQHSVCRAVAGRR